MDTMPPLKDMIVKDYPDLIQTSILSTFTHSDSVFKVCLSPDNHFICTASSDNTARLTNVIDGSVLCTVYHSGPVTGVFLSPDCQWMATSSYDNTARLTKVADQSII